MKKSIPLLSPKPNENSSREPDCGGHRSCTRKLTHARILLKTDQSSPEGAGWVNEREQVAEAVEVSQPTV